MDSNRDSSSDPRPPGHEIDDRLVLTTAGQVKALSHPLRTTVLQLLTERAASIGELSTATRRPRSTVAYHVGVLEDAGLVRVVRTRRVRAVDERYYGRTARTITISLAPDDGTRDFNDFEVASAESRWAHDEGKLWAFIRHARITEEQAGEIWLRIRDLVEAWDRLPRSGSMTYGLAAGVYPVPDHPRLPDPG